MGASTVNSGVRVPRTVEEEYALVSKDLDLDLVDLVARRKKQWVVEIFREWQRTNFEISGFRSLKRFQRLRFTPHVLCGGKSEGHGCFIVLACQIYPGGVKY